jgi:hypothetical protein
LIESVASGVPRLDYYTSGGTAGCPALLVEPSSKNEIFNSDDMTTSWVLGASVSSGYVDVIGVSGNNLTVTVSGGSMGGATTTLRRTISPSINLVSGSTYTVSFLVKKTGAHTIAGYYCPIGGGAAGNLGGGFDVSGSFSSGSIYNTAGTTNRIRRVEQWGTDVYRCSETFTMTASGTIGNFFFAPVTSTTNNNGPAVGEQIAFAAPQFELGSVPTTFIPTTAAPVTRNADVISVTGAVSGCIGQTEGVFYMELQASPSGATDGRFSISAGAGTNWFFIGKESSKIRLRLVASGVVILDNSTVDLTNTPMKAAIAYKSGDFAAYVNGNLVASGTTSFTFSAGLDSIHTGGATPATINSPLKISAAALYTTRLTNAELAALTQL